MFDLNMVQWIIISIAAIFIGFNKAGLPTLGILIVTMLMFIFPAKAAVGVMLPMLIIADVFAVIYYRRNVVWNHLIKLLPWVLIGLSVGYFVLDIINDQLLRSIIGGLVITMVGLHVLKDRFRQNFNDLLPTSKIFISVMGTVGGFTTMVGNAAGEVMGIYLLVQGFKKEEFLGTAAWFFMIVNLIKLPLYIQLGLLSGKMILLDLKMLPIIFLGAVIGVHILPKVPQRVFNFLILGVAVIGGINMLF